jgi:hypothetical protein
MTGENAMRRNTLFLMFVMFLGVAVVSMVLPGCGDDDDRGYNPYECNEFTCRGVCIDDVCIIQAP